MLLHFPVFQNCKNNISVVSVQILTFLPAFTHFDIFFCVNEPDLAQIRFCLTIIRKILHWSEHCISVFYWVSLDSKWPNLEFSVFFGLWMPYVSNFIKVMWERDIEWTVWSGFKIQGSLLTQSEIVPSFFCGHWFETCPGYKVLW